MFEAMKLEDGNAQILLDTIKLLKNPKCWWEFKNSLINLNQNFQFKSKRNTKFSGKSFIIPEQSVFKTEIFLSPLDLEKNNIMILEGYEEFVKLVFPNRTSVIEPATTATEVFVYETIWEFNDLYTTNEMGGASHCFFSLSQILFLMKSFQNDRANEISQKRYNIFFIVNHANEILSLAFERLSEGWRLSTNKVPCLCCPNWIRGQYMYSKSKVPN
jgi:hypothetical protein